VARPRWKLTVRNGADVFHVSFAELGEAVAAMREKAMEVRSQASPKTASLVREFTPAQQVTGRLQIAGRGLLRKPVAGIDVRGDGTFVPFRGGVKREELDPSGHETPFDLVRETLEEQVR
jgi:hypothetical protein